MGSLLLGTWPADRHHWRCYLTIRRTTGFENSCCS